MSPAAEDQGVDDTSAGSVVDRYLARLGADPAPPSIDALVDLQQRHVGSVPWETMWIQLGEPRPIEPAASLATIADSGRGGYCFHLNGAFAALLTHLGYRVTLHAGAVHGPDGPTDAERCNHLVLLVHDLPTDDHPDGTWYVDVGTGDGPTAPMPLREGRASQSGYDLRLRRSGAPGYDWLFVHDPRGGFPAMSFSAEPTSIDAFAAQHERLSTSPDSRFVQLAILLRRHHTGSDRLVELTLTVIDEHGTTVRVIDDPDEWLDVVEHRFHRDLSAYTTAEREMIHLAAERRHHALVSRR
jgi:N-hydroxyarylamine O-acetyltransferase